MAKFKVGDRVRAVKDGLSTKGAVGMLGFVRSVGFPGDTYPVQVEMDAGGTYKSAAVSASYRWSYFNEDALELAAVAPATAALTIEAGKYYKTRDGRKVGPLILQDDDVYPFLDDGQCESYRPDGTWRAVGENHPKDIVAEWIEEPTVHPAPAHTPIAETLGVDLNPPAPPRVGDDVLIFGTIAGITQSPRGTNYNIVFETQNRRMSLHFLEEDFIVVDDEDGGCPCANDNGPVPSDDRAKAFDAMGAWLRSLAVERAA